MKIPKTHAQIKEKARSSKRMTNSTLTIAPVAIPSVPARKKRVLYTSLGLPQPKKASDNKIPVVNTVQKTTQIDEIFEQRPVQSSSLTVEASNNFETGSQSF
jgi:hypothetical protein